MAAKGITWQQIELLVPEGSVTPAGWSVAVTRSDGVGQHQDLPAEATSATFECDAGDYTASVVRVDASGNQIGNVSTAPFTVVAAPAMVSVMVAGPVTVNDVVSVAGDVTAN